MLGMIRCYVAVVVECRNTALSEQVRTILFRWNVLEMVVQPLHSLPDRQTPVTGTAPLTLGIGCLADAQRGETMPL
jgi:hypothetical protein